MKVKCPHCGKKNDWNEMICQKCGRPLTSTYYAPSPSAPPPAYGAPPPGAPNPPPPVPPRPPVYQPTSTTGMPKKSNGAALTIVILCVIVAVIGFFVVLFASASTQRGKDRDAAAIASSSPRSNAEEKEKEKEKKVTDPRKLYEIAGGLSDEGLAPAVAAFLGKPLEEIPYEELSTIRYLEINNQWPDADPMDWVNASSRVVIGLSTHDRQEFATQAEFEASVFRYEAAVESSSRMHYPDLQYFSGLTELRVVAGYVEEQECLHLTELHSLYLNGAENLKLLTRLPNLEELTVDGLSSLEGVGKLPLKKLGLVDARVEDYTPLSALAGLESLTLDDCYNIDSIDFLSGLTQLRELHLLELDEVTDYSPVGALTELESLTVTGTELKRMQFLSHLAKLKTFVCLDNDEVMELPELEGCTNLEVLELDATGLSTLPSLARMPALRSVSLTSAGDLSILQGLTGLTELRLYNCYGNYSAVGSLTGLQRLTISSRFVTGNQSMEFLGALTSLKELNVKGSTLYYLFDSISALTSLESLDISSGEFGGNFSGLSQLPNLKKLRMDNTLLVRDATISGSGGFYGIGYTDIDLGLVTDTLSKLSSLEWLSARGMKLTDLSFASGLDRLTYLDVTDNYITDLSPVQALPSLKTLLADDNPLDSPAISQPEITVGEDGEVQWDA